MGRHDAELTDAIARAVEGRRDDAVGLLQELVRIPSITGEEGALQEVVERAFRERALAVDRWEATPEEVDPYRDHVGAQGSYSDRPNVVGVRSGRGEGRSLLLNAHVDTVASGDPETWSRDQFSGEIEGDLLYGRGSCDMKGGLVTHLAALDALSDLGIELRADVSVAATVGEENGGLGALSTVLRGHRADAALITEPTRLALVPAQGGSLVFRLEIPGRSAHAAVRDEGVSALEKFIPVFDDLTARRGTQRFPAPSALRAPAQQGAHQHRCGARGQLGLDRPRVARRGGPGRPDPRRRDRTVPGTRRRPHRLRRRTRPVAQREPAESRVVRRTVRPAQIPPDAPICEAVKRAHERVTGEEPAVEGVPYGADMRLFIRFGGMPCVMYGTGDVNVAHAPDEHVSITELLTATKTVACLLADWCGVATDP